MVFEEFEKIFNLNKIFKDVENLGTSVINEFSSYKDFPVSREPSCEIKENGNEVKVRYELPGIAREDINLKVSPNYIQINAKTRQEENSDKGIFEKYTKFKRQDFFEYEVIPKQTKARYKDGILEVILKKAENSEENSKVNIE